MRDRVIFILFIAWSCLLIIGCGDDNQSGDGGIDNLPTDSNLECSTEPNLPQLKLASFSISSPESLKNPIIQSAIDSALDNRTMILLFEARNFVSGSFQMRIGPGNTTQHFCKYTYKESPSDWGNMIIDDDGNFQPAEGVTFQTTLYVYNTTDPKELLVSLPLRYVKISGKFSADRNYIGIPGRSAREWVNHGVMDGWISVDDAKNVYIQQIGATLCDLLGGGPGECEKGDPNQWQNPPETIPDGTTLGYHVIATFGASPCTIE